MRVLVCGGRDYNNKDLVFEELDKIQPSFLIEGGAKGADTLAWRWGNINLSPDQKRSFPANWDKHGKAAGYIRNQQMLDEGKPDLVLAFPGGKGTADMVRRAQKLGITVIELKDTR